MPTEPTTIPQFPGENAFQDTMGFVDSLVNPHTETTLVPRRISEQVVLVRSGGSTALYIYDVSRPGWTRVSLTDS